MTTSRPAPSLPGKPLSWPSGPGLTRRCRSVAERPQRCAALRFTRRCGAEPAASRSGAGGGERARAPRAGSSRARATRARSSSRSRETPAPPLGPLLLLSREARSDHPITLQELSEVLSSRTRPDQVVVDTDRTRVQRELERGERDPEMEARHQ